VKTLREALIASYEKRDGHSLKHTHPEHADAALSALRQWLADKGLVVVPREATGAMFSAALQRDDHGDLYHGIYTAMISAAPDALETKP
jgi:hypothetical protein